MEIRTANQRLTKVRTTVFHPLLDPTTPHRSESGLLALAAISAIVNTPFHGRNQPSRLRHASDSLLGSTALLYNGFLAVVVVAIFWLNLPSSKAAVTLDSILWLFLLAVLANVAYCGAYIVDIFVQTSAFRDQWQQFRWLLFTLGVVFAAMLARYVSMGLFAA